MRLILNYLGMGLAIFPKRHALRWPVISRMKPMSKIEQTAVRLVG
jgi:hypothetical protein